MNSEAHFDLSAKQLAEHQNYTDLISLLYQLKTNGRTVFQADSAEIAELYLLYNSSTGRLNAQIRNLLQVIDTLTYNEPYLFPDLLKVTEVIYEEKSTINISDESSLMVRPNPARDYIVMDYKQPLEQAAVITVQDITGKQVTVLEVFNKADQKIIYTHNWNNGVYIATLKNSDKVLESVKFTVVK